MLRLVAALALLGLLTPMAVAQQTQVRSVEGTVIYQAKNATPTSCNATAFVMWRAQPGTVSATANYMNNGQPFAKTGTPPFDNEYRGVTPWRPPAGNDWMLLRFDQKSSQSPTNCQDLLPGMRERFAPGTARVEVTVRGAGTGAPRPPATPGRPAIQGAQVLRARHLRTQRTRATLRLRVSSAGRASTILTRSLPGIRRGRACVAVPRQRPAGARPCVRQVRVGGLITRNLNRAGVHNIVLGSRGLPAGRYRATTTLVSGGTRSAPRVVNFAAPNWPPLGSRRR